MATQSPNSETPLNQSAPTPAQGTELSKPIGENEHVTNGEVANGALERPFMASTEPMREDQVQNAVNFLSHPKVRGSPVIYRRSFLEKKGLTKEEIDEAFRRVPDPSSNATTVEAVTTNQVTQTKHSVSLQPQAPVQPLQAAGVPANSAIVSSAPQPKFQWSHALIATGVLAASGAGTAVFFKNVVVPRLKSWIRKVVAEENESEKEDKPHASASLADQTAEAAKAAVTAAAVVAKASEDLLNSKNEERKYLEAFMNMMDVQVKEMKSMGESIRNLQSTKESSRTEDNMIAEYVRSNVGNGSTNNSWRTQFNHSNTSLPFIQKQAKANGTTNPYMEPWEVSQQKASYGVSLQAQPNSEGLSSGHTENGSSSDHNGATHDSSEPWWKKKTVKITEIDRPMQRSWVPPQPPSVAIPEAAAAIRQPKSSGQKQQLDEIAHSDDGEVGVAVPDIARSEGETSGNVFIESSQSEIEEEQETAVEMS